MKPVLLHMIFAVILVTSVAVKVGSHGSLNNFDNVDAAVVRVATAFGFELAKEVKSESISTFLLNAPDCEQPILVTPVHVTLEEEPLLPPIPRGYMIRYHYLDQIWDKPSQFWAVVHWKKIKALAVMGLTPYLPSEWMLRVDTPVGCASAERIDWQAVWAPNASIPAITRKARVHS